MKLRSSLQASMASGVVDVCLIPEVSFALNGKEGLLAYLEAVLSQRGHAVICMAEGAGQVLFGTPHLAGGCLQALDGRVGEGRQ